jgi:transcription initiation factor TFIIB
MGEQSSITEDTKHVNNDQTASGADKICTDCGSNKLIHDEANAEVICAKCGLVLAAHLIDPGPDWRAFTPEDTKRRRRIGSPLDYTRFDKGLSTTIDWRNKDAAGRTITSRRRAEISRLRKWHRRSQVHSSFHRNLARAMSELNRLASQLNLPRPVKETAAMTYRQTLKRLLVRGRTIEGLVAACTYIACRQNKIPRTLKEIARYSRLNAKMVGRSYRLIVRRLNLHIPPFQATDFIPRFASRLDLSIEVQNRAIQILNKARQQLVTSGKAPTGLAAASLYIASILESERRTQCEIAEVAGCTEVTIRNRYQELVEKLNLEMTV